MSATTTQRLTTETLEAFNKMKARIAASMSFDEFLNRLMDNALSEETITRLSRIAIINETLDSTVNRLLDRMEVKAKA